MFEFKITIEFQKGFLYLLDKEYIFRQHSIHYCTSDILPDLRDAISELSAVLYIQMPYYLLSYSQSLQIIHSLDMIIQIYIIEYLMNMFQNITLQSRRITKRMTWIQVFILPERISSLDYYQNLYYFLNTMNFSFSYGLQPECIKQLNLLHSINSIIRILISKKYSTNLFIIVLEELFLIIFIIYGIYICIYYVILVLLIQK